MWSIDLLYKLLNLCESHMISKFFMNENDYKSYENRIQI